MVKNKYEEISNTDGDLIMSLKLNPKRRVSITRGEVPRHIELLKDHFTDP